MADHNCDLRSTAVTEASNKLYQWRIAFHPNFTCPVVLHIFQYISLYFTIFQYISLYFTYISLCFTIFHYISLYFAIFHLYFTIFHYISLYFTIFHYISLVPNISLALNHCFVFQI